MTPDMKLWTGRVDAGEGELARRWHQLATPFAPGLPAGIGIAGFACEGVRRNQGRVGAAAAPAVIRKALANLAWHQAYPLCDMGDVSCSDGDLDAAHLRLQRWSNWRVPGIFRWCWVVATKPPMAPGAAWPLRTGQGDRHHQFRRAL
jgi:hypothetical protein